MRTNPTTLQAARPGEPGYIRTGDGVNLFYRDWGTGEVVLFVSSWSLPSDAWNYQMLALTERGYRCVAYDARGHGRSSDPGRGYDFDTLADDLAAVLEVLDLRRVTLVGHSIGCGVVTRYLTRHGDGRVARIALLGTITPMMRLTQDNPDGVPAEAFEYFQTQELMKDFPKWVDDNLPPFLMADTSPGMRDWLRKMALATSAKALLECNRSVIDADFRQEMTQITVPTLVLHGDLDVSGSVDLTARRTAALIPGARLKVYEGAAHGLFLTHIDRVNADLLAFISNKS